MKRDMDLIRELMLKLESLPPDGVVRFRAKDAAIQIDGYSPEEVFYHLSLIKEASLIQSTGSGRMGSIEFAGLTPSGHELLASLRLPSPRGNGQDTQPQSPTITMKSASSEQDINRAISRLQARIDELKAFDVRTVQGASTPALTAISTAVSETVERCFGKASPNYGRLKFAARLQPFSLGSYRPVHEYQAEVTANIEQSVVLLQEAQRVLREDLVDLQHEALQAEKPSDHPSGTLSRRVFVVHGHDGEARELVAGFLRKLGFEPVILHEQANRGGTVIEKIEANHDVGFAVVLLTPDDEGRSVKEEQLKPRARQNVLLELGYFISHLGRARVCTLRRGDVDIPSDFAGVVWEAMDDRGGWKLALAREIKAAGHTVDLNLAL